MKRYITLFVLLFIWTITASAAIAPIRIAVATNTPSTTGDVTIDVLSSSGGDLGITLTKSVTTDASGILSFVLDVTDLSGATYVKDNLIRVTFGGVVRIIERMEVIYAKQGLFGAMIEPEEITPSILNNQVLTTDGSGVVIWATPTVGTVTDVTGTSPIVSSGGTTPAISMLAATNANSGYATASQIAAIEANTAKVTMTYPGSGIALSGGALWGTSITNNSVNWNTAFTWGSHAGLYRPVGWVPAWSDITSNPFVFSTPANNDLLKYDGTNWVDFTPTYISSFTEIDPIVAAINGIVKSNGSLISAATAGTDYSSGTSTLTTGILKSTTTSGVLSIAIAGDFPILNQSTSGNSAGLTSAYIDWNGTGGASILNKPDLTVYAPIASPTFTGTVTGITTAMVTVTTDKNYVTDAELTLLGNTSNINSGDETQSTIKTKLAVASSGVDGYLAGGDWNTFNGKQAALTTGVFGLTLLDDATQSDARTTLGLGTMATEAAADYAPIASPTFTGTVKINGGTSGFVGLVSPATPADYTLILPTTIGAVNQVLVNDATTPGTLIWKDLVDYTYAYCYDNIGATLSANTDIVLNSNGAMSNITHTINETGITISTAGVYKIDYGINIDAGIGAALVITIDDVVEESSRIYFVSAIHNYNSSVILNLNAGDVIKLRNASAIVVNRPAVGVNTHIVITKIN